MSLVKYNEVKHKFAPRKDTCMAACIAMATGRDINELMQELEWIGVGFPMMPIDFCAALVRNNVLPVKIDGILKAGIEPNTLHIVVTIVNGSLHSSVLVMDWDIMKTRVYDPNDMEEVQYPFNEENPTLPFTIVSAIALYDCSIGRI